MTGPLVSALSKVKGFISVMDRRGPGSSLDRSFQRPGETAHRQLRRRLGPRTSKPDTQRSTLLNESLQSLFDTAEDPHFDPATYKTQKCVLDHCVPETCPNYHSEKDRRRNVNAHRYDCKPCKWVSAGEDWKSVSECRFKDECRYAHSIYEVRYHPKVYKTLSCDKPHCTLGVACWGKHDTPASPPPPVLTSSSEEVSPLSPAV